MRQQETGGGEGRKVTGQVEQSPQGRLWILLQVRWEPQRTVS